MITALNVANTILFAGAKDKIDISPMKLQKLIYILYKEYLKKTNKKLFNDKFCVWRYGPVITEVYMAFKKYGSKPITDFYYSDDKIVSVAINPGTEIYDVFNHVWHLYKECDGISLSLMTHKEDTAWFKAQQEHQYVLRDEDILREESYEKYLN